MTKEANKHWILAASMLKDETIYETYFNFELDNQKFRLN